jgi:hypothetical protein
VNQRGSSGALEAEITHTERLRLSETHS